jgi:Predicted N-acetylglucosaminyl transferase
MAGQKDISVQEYENKLKGNPRSLVFSRLADSYRKRGDIQQAVDICSLGLKNHPRSTTGRIILGRCYLEQEKFKEAIREFTQVIESEHRNQMALKMLADVYARQGLKEKAGDLYAYLRAMDPENRSIANLCTNFTGTGQTSIYEILGLSHSGPSSVSATDGNQEIQQDILEDIDKTIPLRVVTDETLPQDSGPFAQTMQFDAEELKTAPTDQEFQVEEVISDIAQSVGDLVTGDDITSRMSMMFEEEGKTGDSDVAQEAPAATMEEAESDKEVTEQMPLTALETSDSSDFSMVPGTEISGGDISSRIEQLFGEQPPEEAPVQKPEYSQIFDSTPENSERPGVPDQLQSGAVDTLPEAAQEELAVVGEGSEATEISGEDVVSRMSQLFEAPPDATEQDQSPPPQEPATIIEEEAISGEDVAARLETIFDEQPSNEPLDTGSDILSDDRPATGIAEGMSLDQGHPEPGPGEINQGVLSGALDDTVQPPAYEGPTVDEALDMYDTAVVPENERIPEEAPVVEEEKQVPPETLLTETEETYNDTLTGEESPEMSGDDIVNRLAEIFPENLLQEDTLSIIESIPDDEKEDEEVNAGFYTMSGENAQTTAQSEETLLEKLDDVEIEVPQNSSAEVGDPFVEETTADHHQDTPDHKKTFPNVPDDSDRMYSIPDHVLTPTLADIYFQQGQPNLAVQIYARLLERDPDNEKIARRLDEIKKCISDGVVPVSLEEVRKPAAAGKAVLKSDAKPSRKPRANNAKTVRRPLEGVRIKKDIKNKYKENK